MDTCLVTGGAGFIGSNLVYKLLSLGHAVRVLDDLSTGRRHNLAEFQGDIDLIEGSICNVDLLKSAMKGVVCCYHQAAIPSVPRSVKDPFASNRVNVEGTLNVFLAARDCGLRRVVYASSSSVYGNAVEMPLHETLPLAPVSPYGAGKAAGEFYASAFSDLYDLDLVGLRYFNVFGPRQDPDSAYAAVIPIFIRQMLNGQRPTVEGDGLQGRDFTYVDNVVQANLLAGQAEGSIAGVYNIACGASCSVLRLAGQLNEILGTALEPEFLQARAGDIRQSWANIALAEATFGFVPREQLRDGLERTVAWLRPRVAQ